MSSTSNLSTFKPTYLYIKQHSVTGKLYFGKTVQKPETYLGSGKHWQRHINKHGKEHVVTLWYCLFLDQEDCTSFALAFSKHHQIVESNDWLNLVIEDGLDGGNHDCSPKTTETRLKMSLARKGIVFSDSHKKKLSEMKKKTLISIEGIQYESIKSASILLNIDYQIIQFRLNHKTKYLNWFRLL
jgi:hypothetical protein